ncbi:DUF2339 domain-containing protein [Pigmentiphaga aceris]|uniref:DUF2339 domain-containing protein n=2 Tax=Pigmentiphaga aceris TaxID=1940612 RepID=A0A5C0B5A7_9BURK|nr:DUF2339 domain-containing protein [Pigmentiphaga aceris]
MSTAPEHELVLSARKTTELPSIVIPAGARTAPADADRTATTGADGFTFAGAVWKNGVPADVAGRDGIQAELAAKASDERADQAPGAAANQSADDALLTAQAGGAAVPPTPPAPRGPSFIDRAVAGARAWLFGGNTVLRVGLVLLFLGLAFLLRYATEGMDVPVELRYAGVAAAAVALIGLGWWLRKRNENYALLMQGGGIAVMYLTVFAAMRLHPLLSSGMALGLLVAVTVFSAMLAVLQNALGLAAAAALGGFAAPILTSTGSGNHVALFSYFALLNAGIFAIAWFKAWRLLNLIGFVGTFGIGFAWGLRSYTSELFASTEPFLILFLLMYVGIGLLFARRKLRDAEAVPEDRNALLRWAVKKGDYIDGTLLFGVPVVAFALQFALIRHLEFGPAFSALALGLFYMGLARVVAGRSVDRALLLVETCLALGVIFGTLAIPLGLDARWTSAAWAVEGAGIYWLGLRQSRPIARGFGLLLQLGAALMFLAELRLGDGTTILSGVPLGSLMLGAAMLVSFWNLRQSRDPSLHAWEAWCKPVLAALGCFFLYLLAPLLLGINATAIVLAVAGLATLFAGLRLGERSLLFSAFGAQLGGGALFAGFLRLDDLGSGGVGWGGLFAASMIGLSLVGGMVMAARDEKVQRDPGLMRGLAIVLLVGLVFLNLAVLFVLPWQRASAVWAGSGLLILWLSLHLQQRASFVFGLLLQVVGGLSFIGLWLLAGTGVEREGLPFLQASFWTPFAISLAALIGAWRLQRGLGDEHKLGRKPRRALADLPGVAQAGVDSVVSGALASDAESSGNPAVNVQTSGNVSSDHAIKPALPRSLIFGARALMSLSQILMVWGAAWWALAFVSEAASFLSWQTAAQGTLIIAAGTTALWAVVARSTNWQGLALLSVLLAPVAVVILAVRWDSDYHPAAQFGWLAWLAVFAAHFFALHRVSGLLPKAVSAAAHVLGCWLLITVLSLELRYVLMLLSDSYNAWRWLGWALVPSLFLFAMSLPRRWPWPVAAAPTAYRLWAPLPVAGLMLAWFWTANIFSDGAADPLPYLPLLNPLELGMLFALLGCYLWSLWAMPRLRANDMVQRWAPQIVVGASLFALFTATVFRTAHHWGDVPFQLDAMLSSMLVQAGLSIVWTTLALALMIFGHLRMRREMWLIGAVLIGVVVAKLFFVELSNQGGLARIVSFIGVGVLLLVVGYFAPLPPRRTAAAPVELDRQGDAP